MKTGRRGFFGLMGGAAFAGPGLIKEVTEESMKAAAKVSSGSIGSLTANVALSDSALAAEKAGEMYVKARTPDIPEVFSGPTGRQIFVKQFGIPEFLQRQWEHNARMATLVLDDDLSANKSMSAAGKRQEQRRRDVESAKNRWLYGDGEYWWDMRDAMTEQFPWIGRF